MHGGAAGCGWCSGRHSSAGNEHTGSWDLVGDPGGQGWRGHWGSAFPAGAQGRGRRGLSPTLRGASPRRPGPKSCHQSGSGCQIPGHLSPQISPRRGAWAPAGSPGEEDEGGRPRFPMIPREAVISKQTRPLCFGALGVGRVLLCGGEGVGERGVCGPQKKHAVPSAFVFPSM